MTGPRLGLAVSTIGRQTLRRLLESAAASSLRPAAVAIADQSGGALRLNIQDLPFPVTVVPSSGGVSSGRNAAARILGREVDVLCFPNDDSTYRLDTLAGVAACFEQDAAPAAVACTYWENGKARFALPPRGCDLDRRSVWRALEATTFVDGSAFLGCGGFREDLGTGSPGPWGSGEGTDLLLRLLAASGRVLSRPDLAVFGPSEKRGLSQQAFVGKHKSYARGTGYVYRLHRYPLHDRVRIVLAPMVKALQHDPSVPLSLRLAGARSLGRLEGLRGVTFGHAPRAPRQAALRPVDVVCGGSSDDVASSRSDSH